MRIARARGRGGRPRRRAPAGPGRARVRRLRALAGPRRPGGDARRRRRGTCSSATTTTCSRATATSPRSTTSSGCRDEIEWLPVERRVLRRRAQWPFTSPLDLLRFKPLSPAARGCAWGWPSLLLQRRAERRRAVRAARPRATGSLRAMGRPGVGQGLGPAAARQVRRPRRRHLDGLAVEQAHRSAARSRARRRGRRCSATRAAAGEPLLRRGSSESIESARRPRADRPPRAAARAPRRPASWSTGAPDSFRAGHDPREFAAGGDGRALRRRPRDGPERRLRALLDAALSGRDRRGYLGAAAAIEYHAALCLLLELDRRFSPFYWTNVADRDIPFVGLIEQTNLIEPERYGGRHFLYVANYLEPGDELLDARPRRAARRATSRACGRSTRSSRATGSGSAGCSASRPPSRS